MELTQEEARGLYCDACEKPLVTTIKLTSFGEWCQLELNDRFPATTRKWWFLGMLILIAGPVVERFFGYGARTTFDSLLMVALGVWGLTGMIKVIYEAGKENSRSSFGVWLVLILLIAAVALIGISRLLRNYEPV